MGYLRAWHLALLLAGISACAVILALLTPRLGHLSIAQSTTKAQAAMQVSASPAGARVTHGHGWVTPAHVLIVLVVSVLAGVLVAGLAGIYLVARRLRHRVTREYGLYELKLSMHDQADEQDLVAMVEALANAARELPQRRVHNGQPFIALEAHYSSGLAGQMQWTLCVRCERDLAATVDAIISAAYPDVRLGYEFIGPPREIDARIALPGHVLRLRKERSFVYPITDDGQLSSASPLEGVALAQAAVGSASAVRIQLIPCPLSLERMARERLRQHESRLARKTSLATTSAAQLSGALDRREMLAASEAQDHAWCWVEVQVASDTLTSAKRIAAALGARRGENRLQRRWMLLRQDTYRRRFPSAYPPILPALSLRCLFSVSEIAHLIQLPGARLKGVPLSRAALARVPAPPQVGFALARSPARATWDAPPETDGQVVS